MFWPLMKQWTEHPYDRNGNSSEYCLISGQNICMTEMVILLSTASLVVDVLSTNEAVLTSITIPVVQIKQEW
jgi:hypothetical protein